MSDSTDTIDTEAPAAPAEVAAEEAPVETAAPEQAAEAARVARVDLEDLGAIPAAAPGAPAENIGRVLDVSVSLTARVGVVRKTVSDIIDLAPGSIIDRERGAGEPIDLVIGEKLIAKGEIVVVDDHYGVRLVEVIQD